MEEPQMEERDAWLAEVEAARPNLMARRNKVITENVIYQLNPRNNPRKNKHWKEHFSRWWYVMDVNGKIR